MNLSDPNKMFNQLEIILDNCHPVDWLDIVDLLNRIKMTIKPSQMTNLEDSKKYNAKGTAFISFSYGIDGVSVEIFKYARILEDLFAPLKNPSIHFIGGNFQHQVFSKLCDEWRWYQLDGIDGWDKWDGGVWFKALFRKKMKSYSEESNLLTKEIYKQAVDIAKALGKYFLKNQISLIIPVNITSNPGNIALTLGLVLVSEILGVFVLNINHDFYWEAGKPLAEREPGEAPGVRDHFFRNINNKTFFTLFKSLYPWNGSRWLQANINGRQSRRLIRKYGFSKEKVFEISTCISDTFFEAYSHKAVTDIRLRMGHILSDGAAVMRPVPINDHLSRIDQWMTDQQPVILGARSGLTVDPRSDGLIIMLQPTRIIGRKRIERNLDLIEALFLNSDLRNEFENHSNRRLILHITGPTPKEHQEDLEKVLFAYKKLICILPKFLNDRIFMAFSAGRESHACFKEKNFKPLTIENIYQMADVVVFPSETEGRGLPIIEASACGIPIICSMYRPREVFYDVIGERLSKELRLKYTLFPEGEFHRKMLSEAADLLINPEVNRYKILHNREAVRSRFNYATLKKKFEQLLDQLFELDKT